MALPKIDPYKRHNFWHLEHQFPPKNNGICDCGCGQPLTGRRKRWATEGCWHLAWQQTAVIQGNSKVIRQLVLLRDKGVCRGCGLVCKNKEWHADHIIPVHLGGGGCGLDNFQTLCIDCHKEKSIKELKTLNTKR